MATFANWFVETESTDFLWIGAEHKNSIFTYRKYSMFGWPLVV
jgi:hypothetical protein